MSVFSHSTNQSLFSESTFFLPLHFSHSIFIFLSFLLGSTRPFVQSPHMSSFFHRCNVQAVANSPTFVCHVKFYYTQNSVMYASNSHEMHRLCNLCHYSLHGEFVWSTMLHNERVLPLPLMLYHIMCWIIHRETEWELEKRLWEKCAVISIFFCFIMITAKMVFSDRLCSLWPGICYRICIEMQLRWS